MRGRVTADTWRIRSKCENLGADGKCIIYDDRPDVCKEYKPGSEQCETARAAWKRDKERHGKEEHSENADS